MRFNEIENDLRMRYLTSHLQGKALSQNSALHEDTDYDEVKLAIQMIFPVNAQTYYQSLRANKLKMGVDVADLAIQVYILTDGRLQESEHKVEAVSLEQYYNATPGEIVEWLGDQQLATLMEAAGKVVEYEQNHKSKENDRYNGGDTFREPKRNEKSNEAHKSCQPFIKKDYHDIPMERESSANK